MKKPFLTSCVAALGFAFACLSVSTFAAPQLVSELDPDLSAPVNGNGDSWAPIISPDGRFVLFASTADNLALMGGSNGVPKLYPPSVNVYLRDRLNHTIVLVSVNLTGTGGGNGSSFPTGLSTNGQFALFESAASDLVANDTNNANDVFLRDTINNVTWLVSIGTNGACGNGAARGSTVTPNGHYVAFTSAASNLVAGNTNGIADVFVRDMQAGTTVLASPGAEGPGTTNSSEAPEITPDGRYVAYYSTATNLVPGVTTAGEIYVRDLAAGATTWASTNARTISKTAATGFCYNQAISDNGQYVTFEISSSTYPTTNGFILRYNQQTGLTDTVFTNAAFPMGATPDMRSLNLTPDGRFIAYAANLGSGSCVYLWDSLAGTNILASVNTTNGVTPGANAYWPDVDSTGRYVVFVSTDINLTTSTNAGIFLRDVQAGTTTLVSVDTNGFSLPVDPTAVPALSANGGSVAFESSRADLDGRSFESDVFARDLTNNAAELISVHDPHLPSLTPNGPCALWPGSVSSNAQFIAFTSWAGNLTPNDTNQNVDVFVYDLFAGVTTLVSVGLNDFAGNDYSTEPAISGDGRYVAFTSAATNLIAGDTNQASDVFIRDLIAGTTTLVSVSTNGNFGNSNSYTPTLSGDGRYVLFCSRSSNLAPGTYANDNLFFRDLQLSQTRSLTTGGYKWFSMTPDGHYVAFVATANGNLYVWNSQTAALIYTNSGALTNASVSPDGHWLAYVSGVSLYAQDLIAGTNCLLGTGPFGPRAGLKFSGDGRFLACADTNDVFLYDLQMGTNCLVSHVLGSSNRASAPSDSLVVSADGRFVAYRTFATNCVSDDFNGVPDVVLFDRLTGSNILVSANLCGLSGNNRSLLPVFSGDGQTLIIQSWASDLVAQDYNLGSDLFAFNVASVAGINSTNPPVPLVVGIISAGSYLPGQTPVISWPFAFGHYSERRIIPSGA
jgi:Tol biopolymer transport system component